MAMFTTHTALIIIAVVLFGVAAWINNPRVGWAGMIPFALALLVR